MQIKDHLFSFSSSSSVLPRPARPLLVAVVLAMDEAVLAGEWWCD
jgi:hypothetical protein